MLSSLFPKRKRIKKKNFWAKRSFALEKRVRKAYIMAEKQCSAFRTTIGGQALIEGILMRGPEKQCIVVRGLAVVEADDFVAHRQADAAAPDLGGALVELLLDEGQLRLRDAGAGETVHRGPGPGGPGHQGGGAQAHQGPLPRSVFDSFSFWKKKKNGCRLRRRQGDCHHAAAAGGVADLELAVVEADDYMELFRQESIELRYESCDELFAPVPGDPERLKQVFCNVLLIWEDMLLMASMSWPISSR